MTGWSASALPVTASFATTATKQPVGFIGLGNMGGFMATNLLKAGYPVVAFDVNAATLSRFEAAGARRARNPRDVAAQAKRVVTMLPSSPHVESVYTDASEGLLSATQPGALLIDTSTIDPTVARKVQAKAAEKGVQMLDAPVSGGVGGAEKGTLTFMVGGADEAFKEATDLLQSMGKNIVHCGGPGNGQAAKICNNLVLGISMAGVAEGMLLGHKLGLDSKLLASIFNTSTARCWSSDTYNPVPGVLDNVPSSRGYQGGFGSALMSKDLGLAMSAAQAVSLDGKLPLGQITDAVYAVMKRDGYGDKDFSAVYEFLLQQFSRQAFDDFLAQQKQKQQQQQQPK